MWMITSPYLYAECWNTVKMIEHHWNETAKTKMTACDLHTLKYYMQSPSHWRWWVLHQGQVIETINIHYQHPSLSEPSCCRITPRNNLPIGQHGSNGILRSHEFLDRLYGFSVIAVAASFRIAPGNGRATIGPNGKGQLGGNQPGNLCHRSQVASIPQARTLKWIIGMWEVAIAR